MALVPDSTLNTGMAVVVDRDNSRVIPGSGGAVQKGTDMSRSFNDLLSETNTSGYQPFGSIQLPTTGANPFPKVQHLRLRALILQHLELQGRVLRQLWGRRWRSRRINAR